MLELIKSYEKSLKGVAYQPKSKTYLSVLVYRRRTIYLCSHKDKMACAVMRHRILTRVTPWASSARIKKSIDPLFLAFPGPPLKWNNEDGRSILNYYLHDPALLERIESRVEPVRLLIEECNRYQHVSGRTVLEQHTDMLRSHEGQLAQLSKAISSIEAQIRGLTGTDGEPASSQQERIQAQLDKIEDRLESLEESKG